VDVRALIVDHDDGNNTALLRQLGQQGYTAIAVDSVHQARVMLAPQALDLVLLGVELPDGNGFAFCAEARERLGDATVIVLMTGYNTPLRRVTGIQLGADDVVSRSCQPEELFARIDACQRRRTRAPL
jgi:DNA-binding response OmpR family regulator